MFTILTSLTRYIKVTHVALLILFLILVSGLVVQNKAIHSLKDTIKDKRNEISNLNSKIETYKERIELERQLSIQFQKQVNDYQEKVSQLEADKENRSEELKRDLNNTQWSNNRVDPTVAKRLSQEEAK